MYTFVPYIYHMWSGHYTMDLGSMLFVYFFSLLAIAFIVFGILYRRIQALISYNRVKGYETRTYSFSDEGIEADIESDKINQHMMIKYEMIISYLEDNNSLLIEVPIAKRKMFLTIHDDGYTCGTKDDAILKLTEKGIKRR